MYPLFSKTGSEYCAIKLFIMGNSNHSLCFLSLVALSS